MHLLKGNCHIYFLSNWQPDDFKLKLPDFKSFGRQLCTINIITPARVCMVYHTICVSQPKLLSSI